MRHRSRLLTGSVQPAKPTFRKLKFGALIGSDNPVQQPQFRGCCPLIRRDGLDQLKSSIRSKRLWNAPSANSWPSSKACKRPHGKRPSALLPFLRKQGIRVPQETAVGGPLIEVDTSDRFTSSVTALESSLETLEKVRRAAKSLPHGSPAPGSTVSSHFGSRKDPFTKRHAVHGGLDFRAPNAARPFSPPHQAPSSRLVARAATASWSRSTTAAASPPATLTCRASRFARARRSNAAL